jgi:CxxC-x17-CxxC domain-containing protein
MKDFNRGGGGDRFGGKKRFGNSHGSQQGDRSDRPVMHQAVCAECGKDCEVPFKPSGDKPVYCSSCFGKKIGFDNTRFERRDSERPSFNRDDRREVARPSFNRDYRGDGGSSANTDQYKQQFEVLNTKLDSILKILSVKPAGEKTFEKIAKEEQPVVKKVNKVVKKAKVKKTIAPKKVTAVVKKVVAKKKK